MATGADMACVAEVRLYGALGLLLEDGEGVVHEGSTGCVALRLQAGATVTDLLGVLAERYPHTGAIAAGEYAVIVLVDGRSVRPTEYTQTVLPDHTLVQLLEIYTGG